MAGSPISIKLRCSSWKQLAALYERDLLRNAIFLKSSAPPPLGTPVRINLTLPTQVLIVLRGVVDQHVEPGGLGGRGPGVDIQINDIPEGALDTIRTSLDNARQEGAPIPPSGVMQPRTESPQEGVRLSTEPSLVSQQPDTAAAGSADPASGQAAAGITSRDNQQAAALKQELASLRKLNPFQILGVGYETTDAAVNEAFSTLTKQYHPDRFAEPDQGEAQELATEIFALICKAYHQLGDAASRAKTRRALEVKRVQSAGTPPPRTGAKPPPPPPPRTGAKPPPPPPPRAASSASPVRAKDAAPPAAAQDDDILPVDLLGDGPLGDGLSDGRQVGSTQNPGGLSPNAAPAPTPHQEVASADDDDEALLPIDLVDLLPADDDDSLLAVEVVADAASTGAANSAAPSTSVASTSAASTSVASTSAASTSAASTSAANSAAPSPDVASADVVGSGPVVPATLETREPEPLLPIEVLDEPVADAGLAQPAAPATQATQATQEPEPLLPIEVLDEPVAVSDPAQPAASASHVPEPLLPAQEPAQEPDPLLPIEVLDEPVADAGPAQPAAPATPSENREPESLLPIEVVDSDPLHSVEPHAPAAAAAEVPVAPEAVAPPQPAPAHDIAASILDADPVADEPAPEPADQEPADQEPASRPLGLASEPRFASAMELIDAGRYKEALTVYKVAVRRDPSDAGARAGVELTEGLKALAERDRLEAAQRFEAVLELDPENQRALKELADMRRNSAQKRKEMLTRLRNQSD